jgi:hypothetical protein
MLQRYRSMKLRRYRVAARLWLECARKWVGKPLGAQNLAKRSRTPPSATETRRKPAGRRQRPDIVHSSVYLPDTVYEALRETAFKERCKIHDLIMEGVGIALRKRGYPAMHGLKVTKRR